MNEITKLAVLLAKENIPFEIHTWVVCDRPAIQIASPSKDNMLVDAACSFITYGGDEGLLEVLGSVNPEEPNDDVVGWLTAEQAFKYFHD